MAFENEFFTTNICYNTLGPPHHLFFNNTKHVPEYIYATIHTKYRFSSPRISYLSRKSSKHTTLSLPNFHGTQILEDIHILGIQQTYNLFSTKFPWDSKLWRTSIFLESSKQTILFLPNFQGTQILEDIHILGN